MKAKIDKANTKIIVSENEIQSVISLMGNAYKEIDFPFIEAYLFEKKLYEQTRDNEALKNMMALGVLLGITPKGRRMNGKDDAKPEAKEIKLKLLQSKPKVS